jgi:hypothetical protein
MMIGKQTLLAGILAFALLTAPAVAQDAAPDLPEEETPGLMQRGAEMFLRGLMNEMGPSLREMESALKDVQPEIRKLLALVDDLRNYQAPERLPNGDILIRRKPDAPPLVAPDGSTPPKEGEVDL